MGYNAKNKAKREDSRHGRNALRLSIEDLQDELGYWVREGTREELRRTKAEAGFPVLEQFFFKRIVLDEFHELDGTTTIDID